jgi:linoleate 8R-lipoxygenase / 9,12-octadecadienoate 8-hydroperoxide 8S-isomerase
METTGSVKMAIQKSTSLSARLQGIIEAIKMAFSPEAAYPHEPGNVEVKPTTGILEDVQAMGFKDYETLLAFLNASVTGVINDNDLLLENLIQLLSKLPSTSKEGKQLTDGLLTVLWGTLDHPPVSSLGKDFQYRAPDGSNNNLNLPQLGAAGTPYARSIPPMTFQPPSQNQPEPEQIFESLMARGDSFEPHPQGISSVLFYLATIIIHDIFQTVSSRLRGFRVSCGVRRA